MFMAKLLDNILSQSTTVALTMKFNNGSHSNENLLMFGFLKSLQSIAVAKKYGEVREIVLYIPFLSFFSGSSLLDQSLVHSARFSFSLA